MFVRPVMFLQMNSGSGTDIYDRYGNVGHICGASWVNHGLYFDFGDYVQIPHTERLDALSTYVVISGKFKLASKTDLGQMIIAKGPQNRLFVSSCGNLTYSVDIGTNYPYEVISDITIEIDKWYSFKTVYHVDKDSSDILLYVNNKPTASVSILGQYPMQAGTYDITLGCNSDHDAFFFNGILNYVKIESYSARGSFFCPPSMELNDWQQCARALTIG